MKIIFTFAALFALSACSTLNIDKERAADQRKQELCNDITTRNQPQCSGAYVPPTPHT